MELLCKDTHTLCVRCPLATVHTPVCDRGCVRARSSPLVISLLSFSPPHREMAMDGKSDMGSQKLSTPLSPPELTDCGDRLAL